MFRFLFLALACLLASSSAFMLQTPAGLLTTPAPARTDASQIIMGRGDKRTAKGKRKAKSFGNSRPRNAALRKAAAAKASEE